MRRIRAVTVNSIIAAAPSPPHSVNRATYSNVVGPFEVCQKPVRGPKAVRMQHDPAVERGGIALAI